MPVLSVDHARKSFGSTVALADVSFTLEEGETLAFLGPNGAGKTTLIRSLAGRVALDGGEIALFGTPLRGSAGRRALGVVPQEIALYPRLTARENLEVFGRLNRLAGAALTRKVAWALEWTGLADRAGEEVMRFSGGMKRRLNIACGVLHDPRVILLDEPTVGVDPQSRERIYDMLDTLRASGASLLLTTHQLDEAEARCTRIVIVDHGRVAAQGTLAELVARTTGSDRHVTLRVARPPVSAPAGFEIDGDPTALRARVRDVGADLEALLARARGAGLEVIDVDVRRPTLQSVFLHLTGRELRE